MSEREIVIEHLQQVGKSIESESRLFSRDEVDAIVIRVQQLIELIEETYKKHEQASDIW